MSRTEGSKNGKFGSIIDKTQFEKLCSILCTVEEICGFFGISKDTLNRWCNQEYKMPFSAVFEIKSSIGKISLRRTQFRMAEDNPTMAIWLGKQYLGQSEHLEQVSTERIEVVNDVPESDEVEVEYEDNR